MKYTYLIICFAFLISCSNKLSNSEAINIINNAVNTDSYRLYCSFSMNKKWSSDYKSSGGFCSVTITNPPSRYEQKVLNYLINNGLLKLEKNVKYKDCAQWTINKLEVTDKGKAFLVSQNNSKIDIKTFDFEVDQIKRIDQNQKSNYATVYFSIKEKEINDLKGVPANKCLNTSQERSIRLTKNNNVWEYN